MSDIPEEPEGELLLRTLAMPADTNANGDIFGGWIMSQMDIAGGILAKEVACGRVVTVAVDAMEFHRPVEVGDIVCVYGRCVRIGNTSLTTALRVWVKPILRDTASGRYCVTEAQFTYVAIDDDGKPRRVPQSDSSSARAEN